MNEETCPQKNEPIAMHTEAPAINAEPCSMNVESSPLEPSAEPLMQAVKIWKRPVLRETLARVEDFLRRYIAFPSPWHSPAIALWVAHSHAITAFDYTPYLHISSPEKRCGKSRVLDVLNLLVSEPWPAISPSEAVIYRKIDISKPTLLLDEVDTIFTGGKDENKEGLRALLNAGFNRASSVPRCTGKDHEIADFSVFCAKVIAGIGKLPDTVADRCIPIILARKRPDQVMERFRSRDAAPEAGEIKAALTAWVRGEGVIDALRIARPELPECLGDRQADICEPLLAIADAAGGRWPERARAALVELLRRGEEEAESLGVKALAAIHQAFLQADAERLSTEQILESLMRCEDDPWAAWWESDVQAGKLRGPGSKLARLLKPFGIESVNLRMEDDSVLKGYKMEAFQDAWARYLPASTSARG